jgi:hypothetical protein
VKQLAKVPLTKDNHVVKAVPPDRTDKPLRVSVLPWRARRDRSVSNAHRPNTPNEDLAIGAIVIADEISRRFLPAVRFGQLLRDPLGARMEERAYAAFAEAKPFWA